MPARVIRAADGREWVVRRRWSASAGHEPLWERFRRRSRSPLRRARDLGDAAEASSFFGDLAEIPVVGVAFAVIAIAILAVVVILLLVIVVIPLLVALAELALLLGLAALAVAGRMVLRHPWTIEARPNDGTVLRWTAVGFRASRDRRDDIAASLAAGIAPSPDPTQVGG
jgi:hypothetical protein